MARCSSPFTRTVSTSRPLRATRGFFPLNINLFDLNLPLSFAQHENIVLYTRSWYLLVYPSFQIA